MKTKFSNNNLLSSAVLVLNANYSPMTVCTAKRAISLYFLDKIDIKKEAKKFGIKYYLINNIVKQI